MSIPSSKMMISAATTDAPALPKAVEYLGLVASFLHWPGTSNFMIQCTIALGDEKKRLRLSAKTSDPDLAQMRARKWLRELILQTRGRELGIAREVVAAGRALPLEQAFRVYEQDVLDTGNQEPAYAATIRLAMQLALNVWKPQTDASSLEQKHVDTYLSRRTMGGIRYDGADKQGNKKPMRTKPVSEATALVDLKLLRQVFRYLVTKKLLVSNPLRDHVTLPRIDEEDVLRPVMSEERYQLLLSACDEVERWTREHAAYRARPGRGLVQGALRTFLVLARKTGRRGGAVAGLRVGNILLTEERLITALAGRGFEATRMAEAWPYGAILWAPFKDKRRKYPSIIPLSKELHDLLVEYLAELKPTSDEQPLFPSVTDHTRPMTARYLYRRFTRCEEICRERGHRMPKIKHGGIHMLRRQRRTELAGRFHDNLVALSIGWKPPRGGDSVMNSVYLRFMQASPESLYHVAEFDVNKLPAEDALPAGVLVRVPLPPRPTRRGG